VAREEEDDAMGVATSEDGRVAEDADQYAGGEPGRSGEKDAAGGEGKLAAGGDTVTLVLVDAEGDCVS